MQGINIGDGVGHGVDPNSLDGVNHLHTGNLPDSLGGGEITGPVDSHSDVLIRGSDAWYSIDGFFSEGEVTLPWR